MFVVESPLTVEELKGRTGALFETLVKAVVDIEQGILAVDAEMHADLESMLIEARGSDSDDLWGINLYPDSAGEGFIEFNSLINVKPHLGNRSMDVNDENVRELIREVVRSFVRPT